MGYRIQLRQRTPPQGSPRTSRLAKNARIERPQGGVESASLARNCLSLPGFGRRGAYREWVNGGSFQLNRGIALGAGLPTPFATRSARVSRPRRTATEGLRSADPAAQRPKVSWHRRRPAVEPGRGRETRAQREAVCLRIGVIDFWLSIGLVSPLRDKRGRLTAPPLLTKSYWT